jgi:hypothetical protein
LTESELRRRAVPDSIRSRWPIWAGLLVVLHGVIGGGIWFTPRVTASIENSAITAELGLAFSANAQFERKFLYALPTDTSEEIDKSDLVLFESDRPLGPAHAVHADIRVSGGGRYSHWNGSIIFSTPDGSDPRTNGRVYSIASPTEVKFWLRVILSAALLLLDAGLFVAFQRELLAVMRSRGALLCQTIALLAIATAGLSAAGAFGTLVVAKAGMPKDAALSIQALQHAILGCLISIGIWAAGAGVTRSALREPRAHVAQILIPAFPVGLILLAGLVTVSLVMPYGRLVAIVLWGACLLPLFGWRPPRKELDTAVKATLCIIPFAIAFGVWLGLLWHGPTETLSASPTGDLTSYAGAIWSLADRPYPYFDPGYENAAGRSYFNSLFPGLGAALLNLPGFDPFLYLLASGGASYVLFSTLMLHLYVADRAPRSVDPVAVLVLVLCFVVAARYPYWVVESIPVVFVPALTIAVWWMAERGQRGFWWTVAALVAALCGSIVSKVATAVVLVPLGAGSLWRQFGLFPPAVRAVALAIGCLFGAYCAAMLLHFLPLFLRTSDIGPECLRYRQWWFVIRDLGTLLLALLAWLVADVPVALALSAGLLTFLLFSFLFQINFVCVTILLGLMIFANWEKLGLARSIAFVAFAMALPAMMFSDPAGATSGTVWIVCVGGAALVAISSTVHLSGVTSTLRFRTPAAIGLTTLLVTGLGLVGVARGYIIVNSGYNRLGPQLTPELRDIWTAVRRLTPHDSLIFTDEVDETINVLGGWNTYAYRGQRQIYLSSYYTNLGLRADHDLLDQILALNKEVLNGTVSPTKIPTRSHYDSAFAVVSQSRTVPSAWKKLYSNKDYSIFEIMP